MTAKAVMVLGTTSGAGKSWLTTALCRYYARQGLKVAPYKAQNMSNNARVVAGGEIGSAQYFQALAANTTPEVRMNPLLLKPEKDTQSQVILMGQVNAALSKTPWRERSVLVWPVVAQALDELMAENDVVVIEGAGSPAEINLKHSDIVNMRVALHANAACLLVTDIDRGGAFAHLYGTWAMLQASEQKLIKGFVLNKFRGDAKLLAPGPQMLQDLTGVPTVATLPMWWQHGPPEEDGVDMAPTLVASRTALPPEGAAAPAARQSRFHGPDLNTADNSGSAQCLPATIAVIAYPRISNLDEFQPLKNVPGVRLVWVRSPAELADLAPSDWIILPGSKATSGDLAWLRAQRLDQAVNAHAARGGAVLGICGGLQMLGEALIDPHGIETIDEGNAAGLGLLGVVTVFEEAKTVRHRQTAFSQLAGPWTALSNLSVKGYEIHHGKTALRADMADGTHPVMAYDLAWQNAHGNVLGVYLHGMFEDPAVLRALFGVTVPTLDSVFDGLAQYIAQHFEASVLESLIA